MQPKIIFSSSPNNDEELLIPFASDIREELAAQQQQPNFRIIEKPPSCFCCCNTRIGCYIIAALQVALGFFHLIYAISFLTDPRNDTDQPTLDGQIWQSKFGQTLILGIYSIYVVASGLLLFQGLSFKKGKLLKPSMVLSLIMIGGLLIQFIYFFANWDQISDKLRVHLKYYCSDAEEKIASEILLDQEARTMIQSMKESGADIERGEKMLPQLNSMIAEENEELAIWQEIDRMVNDDEVWEESTKNYLMILVGGFMTFNMFLVCAGFGILAKQYRWMKTVGQW